MISVTGETLSRNESAKGTLISAKPDKIVASNKKIRLSIWFTLLPMRLIKYMSILLRICQLRKKYNYKRNV
jgi:hypothetical protein